MVAIRKQMAKAPQGNANAAVENDLATLKAKFEEAMNNDLNTAVAVSILFELVRLGNKLLADDKTTSGSLQAVDALFRKLGGEVLGIVKDSYAEKSGGDDQLLDHLMVLMIEQRKAARARKDFAASDAIRDKLSELGVVLEDKPGGVSTWRRK